MLTKRDPKDLTGRDLALSHFTLGRYHDVEARAHDGDPHLVGSRVVERDGFDLEWSPDLAKPRDLEMWRNGVRQRSGTQVLLSVVRPRDRPHEPNLSSL
jgi:hypothetical protein